MRTHRVGTITLGVSLVLTGIFFIVQTIFSQFAFLDFFKLWPVIFILLGGEILFSNARDKNNTFVYDKTAIFLIVVLILFAMFMAVIGYAVTAAQNGIY